MGALWRGEDEVVPPTSSSYFAISPPGRRLRTAKNGTRLPWTGMAHATPIVPALRGNGPAGCPVCARPPRCSGNASEGGSRTVSNHPGRVHASVPASSRSSS
jgi:hypothetical protein